MTTARLPLNELRADLQAGRLCVVVGTGVTAAATAGPDGTLPTASWTGLVEDAIDRCVSRGLRDRAWGERAKADVHSPYESDLIAAAEKATDALGGRRSIGYSEWLRDAVGDMVVTDAAVPEAIKMLAEAGALIATTNYDSILEETLAVPAVTWRDSARAQRVLRGHDRAIVHLHGHWAEPESVVFGSSSYADVLRDENAGLFLRTFLYTGTVLFVGFGAGLNDPNFSALRRWLRTVLRDSSYEHYRIARQSQVATFQAQHDSDEHIRVISSGPEHADLPAFLRSLTSGVNSNGLRGLAVASTAPGPAARRSPTDTHIPLPVPAGRRDDLAAVAAAAARLHALLELDAEQLSGQELERARRFSSLFEEEIRDLTTAAARAEDLAAPQLDQVKAWAEKLLQILDADR